jgi:hypothetical protein
MRSILKRVISPRWQRNLHYLRNLSERLDLIETTSMHAVQGVAGLLQERRPANWDDAEFRIFSQFGEDGILQYIFQTIGHGNRTFVEFGIQSGRQCNSALLALCHGWSGLFIEGDPVLAAWGREYYDNMLTENAGRVRIKNAFITTANINDLIGTWSDGLDLLSIDIDGNDYWVWEAITGVKPRVVVVEYNAVFGLEPLTIPYAPAFQRGALGDGMYFGASLAALEKLGAAKGYALVGCGSTGINAFFVREDLVREPLRRVAVPNAFRPHYGLTKMMSAAQQFALVEKLPLSRV